MTTTTTDTAKVAKVSASVLDQYNRFQAGESKSDIGKALGIAAATVGANVKRVQAKVDDGFTLTTEDGGEVTTTAAPPAPVDVHAIADEMTDNASIVTLRLVTLEGEGERLRAQGNDLISKAEAALARAHEQAQSKFDEADTLTSADSPAMAKVHAVASALGFDIEAWRARVAEVQADADKADADKADADKADADKAS